MSASFQQPGNSLPTIRIPRLSLESGACLSDVDIAYEWYGNYANRRNGTILICHALTGDAHAGSTETGAGWWDGLIGPGRVFDTDRYFVVCSNVLGGCAGSTGPASERPDGSGKPYGPDFPLITIRDMVEAQRHLLDALGVETLHAVAGGSMGGMQALEWAVTYPDRVRHCIAIATSARLSAWAIAFNDVMRLAIMNDPHWMGGRYYENKRQPEHGLSLARMVGMITYRSPELYNFRFDRNMVNEEEFFSFNSRFQVESYLRYQGEKLVRRFDANSYLYLIKAMDLHDVGRDRGGLDAALSRVSASVLLVGINTDHLYPTFEQIDLYHRFSALGKNVVYREMDSIYGHDAFLVEYQQLAEMIQEFFVNSAYQQ